MRDITSRSWRRILDAAWRIITPIEEGCAQLPALAFPNYPATGAEANALVGRGGHH
ncbi:MAG: hypothetical protein M3Y05_11480 [Gemmatimonadota bacterium]|nr:hypothetical protein [Gemmatimonadota bacterium]